jgi:YHS domain-containing protein
MTITTKPKGNIMADIGSLLNRIDHEFEAGQQSLRELQAGQLKVYEDHERRLASFGQVCEKLSEVWRPRMEALARKFGEHVKLTPSVSRELREATFEFESDLAYVRLRFTASTDQGVSKLVLDYDLEIRPILMKYERHQHVEFPLDAADPEAVAGWIDDRIIDFVRTYLSLYQNEYYLKDHMAVDPVAGVRFPKFAAACILEWQGKKQYFIGEKTRREFQKQHGIE